MQEGIIISNISNQYMVKVGKRIYKCNARGKLKQTDISPVVGDRVEVEIINEEESLAIIAEIMPRGTYIKRPKVSNITQMILVISTNMPKPNILMLDKQLAFAEWNGIVPIIVINKIDLGKKDEIELIEKTYKNIGYKVIKTNAKMKEGLLELRQVLNNQISAFSGNSGVGKSTLINSLFEDEITKEGIVSYKNKRGKNTTTSVTLYQLEENSYIADTPGFSTFDIEEIEAKYLENYFVDIKQYIKNCEYVGCRHIKEEQCGVKEAVEEGKIDRDRYERFIKIYQDLKQREEHKW